MFGFDVALVIFCYFCFGLVFHLALSIDAGPFFKRINNRPLRLAVWLGLAVVWPVTLVAVILYSVVSLFIDSSKDIMR